ncbi:MAG: carbohydrate kinase family protein [Traorella sp.]
MKCDVVIIGAAILDVLALPTDESVFEVGSLACEDIKLSYGGDAFNEAILLSKMNTRVELVTLLGNDEIGYMIQRRCDELNIILKNDLDDEIQTGVNVVLVKKDGSRHFLTNQKSSLRRLSMEHIHFPFHEEARVLCFASIFVFPFIQDHELSLIFTQAKKQDMIIVADMTKCKNQETISDMRESLSLIDYLIPNDEEIKLFTRSESVEEACGKLLIAGVKNIIVKCGSEGCYVCNESERYWCLGHSVNCVDTTGAGDSFVAGFIKKLLEGKKLQECVDFANECGSRCVQVIGASEWL